MRVFSRNMLRRKSCGHSEKHSENPWWTLSSMIFPFPFSGTRPRNLIFSSHISEREICSRKFVLGKLASRQTCSRNFGKTKLSLSFLPTFICSSVHLFVCLLWYSSFFPFFKQMLKNEYRLAVLNLRYTYQTPYFLAYVSRSRGYTKCQV
jgi:hypothetical protein